MSLLDSALRRLCDVHQHFAPCYPLCYRLTCGGRWCDSSIVA
ncbi:MAG: hypothetical protein ACTS81_01220 [Arsenophonus sp. ER-BJ3-MAG3]